MLRGSYPFFYLVGISGAGRGLARAGDGGCLQLTNPWLIGANMLTIYRSSVAVPREAGRWHEATEVEKYER